MDSEIVRKGNCNARLGGGCLWLHLFQLRLNHNPQAPASTSSPLDLADKRREPLLKSLASEALQSETLQSRTPFARNIEYPIKAVQVLHERLAIVRGACRGFFRCDIRHSFHGVTY
jgi:hypothetical protein